MSGSRDPPRTSAEHLGIIPNDEPEAEGRFVPANAEMAVTLYDMQEFFASANTLYQHRRGESASLIDDIKTELEALLAK